MTLAVSRDKPARASGRALLFAIACAMAGVAAADEDAPAASGIRVNQLGFLPAARKLAVVGGAGARAFAVVRETDGVVVHRGTLAPARPWAPAGSDAALADLGPLAGPGRYRIEVDGLPPSDPFPVEPGAYARLADAAAKAFYFHRAGVEPRAEHAGAWARAAGHADDEVAVHASAASASRPEGTPVAAPGGWYDAGDYN